MAVDAEHAEFALMLRALISGKARWEPFDEDRGEFIFGGLRYTARLSGGIPLLDEFTVSKLSEFMVDA